MKLLDRLLIAASRHGAKSDPDHEVGDLQDILRSCWNKLTSEQQASVFAEHKQKVEDWT